MSHWNRSDWIFYWVVVGLVLLMLVGAVVKS